jgi:uncharacterized protein (DUF2062 family)
MGVKAGKRPFLARLRALFTVRESPKVVAGTFAVALLCGTSPLFVGIILLPILIRVLRLNKVLAIAITTLLLANPLMIFLMVGQAWLGLVVLGKPVPAWLFEFRADTLMKAVKGSPDLLLAYAVGGYGSSIIMSTILFICLWPVLEWKRANARKKGAKEI